MRVLIADDSEVVCQRLRAMLSELPEAEVVGQATNSSEAISCIQELQPDVVILDIRMPGGSGIDVLRTIKKNDSAPKVIVLTNYPYPQYRKACMDAGAEFFLDKSTEFEKVTELIKQLS
jgi:DNA-binding NarL/FixJ family response regulator